MATLISNNKFGKRIKKAPVSLHLLVYLIMLAVLGTLLQGCVDKCETTQTYTYYEPVYTSMDDLRDMVSVTEPESLQSPGKIYFKDGYLFISEIGKGIHVINDTDPSYPFNVAFISIPGTSDLSAKGNYLYADSYIDLVVLDISSLDNIHEVNRVEGIFDNYNSYGYYADTELGVVTGWKQVDEIEVYEGNCDEANNDFYYRGGGLLALNNGIAVMEGTSFASDLIGSNPGVGGSMATFTIYNDYLYTINDSELNVVDISVLGSPMMYAKQYVGWGIETIFPYEDKLFIGSNSGMYIYDNSDPKNPTQISVYDHITSCDPVVVEGDYAYVTLRSGTECQGFTNQLEVVNISDLTQPTLEATYAMFNPHGLGIDNSTLFICDGAAGLKIYDATDIYDIENNLKKHYGDLHALDVIPLDHVLMMIGEDGISQYDYTDLDDIKFLSLIPVNTNN